MPKSNKGREQKEKKKVKTTFEIMWKKNKEIGEKKKVRFYLVTVFKNNFLFFKRKTYN